MLVKAKSLRHYMEEMASSGATSAGNIANAPVAAKRANTTRRTKKKVRRK